MARTRNSFTGSAGDDTLVDKVLGRSYDVVKDVYLALPKLTELQENPNVAKLAENFEDVQKVLNNTDNISQVSENLDGILAASSYSAKAKAFSDSAQSSADLANTASVEATNVLNQATQVRDSLQAYEQDLEVVADNIKAVQTTSANIVQINHLSDVFKNNLTIPKIDEVLANLDDILSVAENITEVTQVANKFIGTGQLDRIESASRDIQDNLLEYKQILEDIRVEVTNAALEVDKVEDATTNGVNTVNAEAALRRAELNDIIDDCNELLEQISQANDVVSANVDESNEILLKIRDIYHSFEEALNKIHKRMLLELQHEGDHQCYRIRKEGELQAERLYSQMTEIIQTVADDMREQAEEIMNQKLEELKQKADEIIAEIEKKLEEINLDFTDFENRLDLVEQAIQELKDLHASQDTGDIRFGYVDYSQPENQEDMIVGTTYIVPFDENHQYIQINPDTNSFAKDPTYLRFYIKSVSGNVSYVEKNVKMDLSSYLKQATTDTAGIAELATLGEVEEGKDAIRIVTPYTLNRGLPHLLIKNFEQNPNGLTNNIVQQIIKTIASDTHLQEDLADSIKDDILGDLEGGIGQPGEDISFNGDITFKGDNVFEGNSEFQGDVNFSGNVTVPDQVPPDDPSQWPGDTVINKDDIIKLIENSKKTSIEVLSSYPTSIDSLEEDVLYSCPLEDSGNEITIITLRENEQASTATVQEGEQAFFAAGDLL